MEDVIDFVFGLFLYNVENVLVKCITNNTRKSNSYIVSNDVEVLHLSDNFLVVNKPFDLVINSNDPTLQATLQMHLRQLFPHLVNPKLPHDFYFVHRLDYATSGVICLALQKEASSAATSSFEKREAKKYYIALLRGQVHDAVINIDTAIGEDATEQYGNHRMCVSTSSNCILPRSAHTRVIVLQRGLFAGSPATKVLLRPITGRRHQLRVHCASIGHSVIGDFTYSNRMDIEPYRMFLHSYRLILPNCIESLDVKTLDPFTRERGAPDWRPTEFVNSFTESVFDILDTDAKRLP